MTTLYSIPKDVAPVTSSTVKNSVQIDLVSSGMDTYLVGSTTSDTLVTRDGLTLTAINKH